jgi:hypothetical protein
LLYFIGGGIVLSLACVILKYKLSFRDVISLIVCGPIVWFTFTMGIWKGFLLKIFNRLG